MSGRKRTLPVALRLVLLAATLFPQAARAADDEIPARATTTARWIHVPADNPQSWPTGPWVAVPSSRLKSWMSGAVATPPSIWIREAQYQAVYRDGILADGQMTANLKSTPGRDDQPLELLDWSGSNLAFERLVWPERAAELGETPGGQTWLLVPRGETRLSGTWTRQGRPLTNGRVFDLTLPPAAVSELRLDVPRGLSVRTGGELPTRREPSDKVDHDRWIVSTGSRRDVQLVIVRDEPEGAPGVPRIFHRSNTAFAFAQDEFRLRQEILLEAPEGPIESLSVVLPDQIEIRQVILGNSPLSSWRIVDAPTRQLEIRFPEPILGLSRPLVIVGRLALQPDPVSSLIPDEPLTLDPPRPRVGTSMSEQVTLNVLSPLELKSVQADGYRQIAVSSSPGTSHSLIYQRYAPESVLRVRVGPPQSLARVSLVTRVDADLTPQQAVCELLWRMSSGETYEVSFRLAPGWEPETIELHDAEQDAGVSVPDWFVKQQFPDGSRAIGVELPRSLNPDHPQRVRARLRRTATDPAQPLSLPLIEPIDARRERHLIALRHSSMSPDADLPVGFRKIGLDELPPDLRTGSTLRDVEARPGDYDLFSVTGAAPLPLRVWDRSACRPSFASVRIDVTDAAIHERITCLVPACGNRLDQLRMTLPAGTSGWSWSVSGQPRVEVTVSPREAVSGRTAIAPREDWELQFDPPLTAEFELVGSREISLGVPYRVALPWPIGTDEFLGEIEIRDPRGLLPLTPPLVASQHLQSLPLPPDDEAVTLRARYVSSRAELLFGSEMTTRRSSASRGVLRTTAHRDDAWSLANELTFLIAPGENLVEWTLPPGAAFAEVHLDGQRVSLTADDRGSYRLTLQPSTESREVRIAFRTSLTADRWTFAGSIPLPELVSPLDSLSWKLFLPREWEIAPQRGGPLAHTPATQMTWVQRLFGPLGRTAGETVFNPLERNAWQRSSSTAEPKPAIGFESDSSGVPPTGWREWNFSRAESSASLAISGWSQATHRQLAWVALFACLTAGVALRVFRARFRAGLGAVWISGTVIFILLASPRWAETAGGLFTGSLVAALLPRTMILGKRARTERRDESAVPTGSTLSRQPVALWFAAAILGGGVVSAQNSTSPAPAPTMGEPRLDVLVPYQTLPVSTELPEIVYLRERDHRRLFGEGSENDRDLLLTSAKYTCEVDASGLAELRAEYAITLLDAQLERVAIPLRGANLAGRDACRVDGLPAAATIDEQGRFVILVPRAPEVEMPSPSSPPGEFRRLNVSLKLYPPTTTTESGQRLIDLGLPLLSTNHLTASLAPELDYRLFLEGAEGETRVARDGRRLECQLGRAASIRLGWQPASVPAVGTETAPRVDVSAMAFIETRLTHLVYRVRASHTVAAGRVEALTWALPAEWSLRSLTAPGLLQHRLRANPDGTRSLVLDLRQPAAAGDPPIVADAVFLAPALLGAEDELRCPLPDLFSQRVENVGYECRASDVRVGIWSPPEVALTPFELPQNRLRLYPVEDYLAAWPPEEQLPTPRFCYSVQQLPIEPTYVYTTTRPKRLPQGVQLQGILRGDALEWGWSGEIVTSETPAFQHEFRIDPRLEILSVSVKEDRAERLNRWSVRNGHLTILLNRKTEGRQTVEIEARLPIGEAGVLKLPEIRPLQAESTQIDLELSRIPLWEVSIASTATNQLQPDEAVLDPVRGLVPLARFQLADGAPLPSLELKRADERGSAARRSQLRLRADGRFDLITTFEVEPTSAGGELIWRLPSELARDMSYDSGAVELAREDADDGWTTFRGTVLPMQDAATIVDLRITLPAPEANRWTLVLPELIDARLSHDRFVCRASDGWFPVSDRGEPAGAGAGAETDPNDAGEIVFEVASSPVELRRAALVRADTVPKIPLLIVWSLLESDRPLSGRWLICYEGSGLDDLTIHSTQPLREVVCRVNGRTVESSWNAATRQFQFPLPPRPGISFIEIDWVTATVFRPTGLEEVSIPRPLLEDIAVQQSELAVFHANDYSELTHKGVTASTAAEFRYRVLEKLVSLLPPELDIERDPATEALRDFAASQLSALRRFSVGLDPRGLRREGLDADDFDQFLTEAAMRLEPLDPAGERFGLPGLADSQPLPEYRFLAGALEAEGDPRLWLVDRRDLLLAIAIALALIAIPLGRWLFRLESGEWLGAHRARAWLLLGLLWWFGFRFSALGAGLTFAAFLYWSFAPAPRVVKGKSSTAKAY